MKSSLTAARHNSRKILLVDSATQAQFGLDMLKNLRKSTLVSLSTKNSLNFFKKTRWWKIKDVERPNLNRALWAPTRTVKQGLKKLTTIEFLLIKSLNFIVIGSVIIIYKTRPDFKMEPFCWTSDINMTFKKHSRAQCMAYLSMVQMCLNSTAPSVAYQYVNLPDWKQMLLC